MPRVKGQPVKALESRSPYQNLPTRGFVELRVPLASVVLFVPLVNVACRKAAGCYHRRRLWINGIEQHKVRLRSCRTRVCSWDRLSVAPTSLNWSSRPVGKCFPSCVQGNKVHLLRALQRKDINNWDVSATRSSERELTLRTNGMILHSSKVERLRPTRPSSGWRASRV